MASKRGGGRRIKPAPVTVEQREATARATLERIRAVRRGIKVQDRRMAFLERQALRDWKQASNVLKVKQAMEAAGEVDPGADDVPF